MRRINGRDYFDNYQITEANKQHTFKSKLKLVICRITINSTPL